MSDVHSMVIERLLNNFGAPQVDDLDAFYEEFYRALTGTEESLLRAAMDCAIDRHAYPMRWPTVAECKAAVDHIANERALARSRGNWGNSSELEQETPSPESKERVAALMRAVRGNFKKSGFSLAKEQAKWVARQKAKMSGETLTAEQIEAAADAAAEVAVAMPDVSRPAWEKRMRESETARWLSLPREVRDDILGSKPK